MSALVSVIIPTYKRSEFLERAISSILTQSYHNIEIVVVDDNDPDSEYREATEVRIQAINDNRVKYVKNEKKSWRRPC